ncbi:uncharacterized protein si:dkey-16j16.4 [Triplophysa dalaica]|uniref:uncharacterized protein si:dkey-16j16.4 n=1 Tax=Triplophysa dalaica TaxID=1582913 RepID=UPI0024DF63C0|nr:uncharacterized protein si:dkey-16j16.4 [Triplophysa dalaica]
MAARAINGCVKCWVSSTLGQAWWIPATASSEGDIRITLSFHSVSHWLLDRSHLVSSELSPRDGPTILFLNHLLTLPHLMMKTILLIALALINAVVQGHQAVSCFVDMLKRASHLTEGTHLCSNDWVFQQDNAAGHNARLTKDFFQENNDTLLDHPACSPDLIPIENIRGWMISYHGIEEGGESDDSEGENQELAQIDRERRRNCILTPLATSQQHNQGVLSPSHLRHLRFLLDPTLDHHSSEEVLERFAGATWAEGGRKWQRHGDISSASSDEEVKDLCGQNELPVGVRLIATSPRPALFRSSPPRALKLSHTPTRLPVRPIIRSHFEQPSMPYWRNRPAYTEEPGRPSLDLEKMQQKMLLKKNCGGKTRTIKIQTVVRRVRWNEAVRVWKSEAFMLKSPKTTRGPPSSGNDERSTSNSSMKL